MLFGHLTIKSNNYGLIMKVVFVQNSKAAFHCKGALDGKI